MLTGSDVVAALKEAHFTHVVWIPDSVMGTWEAAIVAEPSLQLIRVSREGEAVGVAAGLLIGGKRPALLFQCTGFFEAGDAIRNFVHDIKLPLFIIIGVRSWNAYLQGVSSDTCPPFIEPIMNAWKIPYRWLNDSLPSSTLLDAMQAYGQNRQSLALLLPE